MKAVLGSRTGTPISPTLTSDGQRVLLEDAFRGAFYGSCWRASLAFDHLCLGCEALGTLGLLNA